MLRVELQCPVFTGTQRSSTTIQAQQHHSPVHTVCYVREVQDKTSTAMNTKKLTSPVTCVRAPKANCRLPLIVCPRASSCSDGLDPLCSDRCVDLLCLEKLGLYSASCSTELATWTCGFVGFTTVLWHSGRTFTHNLLILASVVWGGLSPLWRQGLVEESPCLLRKLLPGKLLLLWNFNGPVCGIMYWQKWNMEYKIHNYSMLAVYNHLKLRTMFSLP